MAPSPDVLVYYKPGCPFAARLRVALTLARVPYRSVTFSSDEDGAARVRQVAGGNEGSPTVLVGDTYLVNPLGRPSRPR